MFHRVGEVFIMRGAIDVLLDLFIRAILETVAVAEFVTAARKVLASASVGGDLAGVVLKKRDVR